MSKSKPDPFIGQTFDGRYLIEKRLGEGGMGVVYAARHTVIGKRIAVKVLRKEYASDKEIVDRFVLEAKTASSIGNPHIVDISDFGTLEDGATYFVMELLEGEPLTEVIQPGGGPAVRMKPERLCAIARQLCDGLGAAHANNIVHRDLKPDNIFLVSKPTPDFAKILDFGIAKVTNTATQKTRAGQVFGTPHYMSPEQAAGRPVDARSDIYAIGVILYEMATGRLPFLDETYMGILTAHMYRSPEPIRSLEGLEQFPLGLDAVIQKCLAKHVDFRYQTMGELDTDLRRVVANEEPEAVGALLSQRSASGAGRAPLPTLKRATPLFVIGIGLVAAVGLVFGALYLKKRLDTSNTSTPTATATAEGASTPQASDAAPHDSAPSAPATPVSAAPSAAASTSATPAAKAHVTFKVVPASAVITIDDGATKGVAVTNAAIDVDPSHPVTAHIEAPGFAPQTITIDGKTAEIVVTLLRGGGVVPTPPTPSTGTSKVIDSWGPRPGH